MNEFFVCSHYRCLNHPSLAAFEYFLTRMEGKNSLDMEGFLQVTLCCYTPGSKYLLLENCFLPATTSPKQKVQAQLIGPPSKRTCCSEAYTQSKSTDSIELQTLQIKNI